MTSTNITEKLTTSVSKTITDILKKSGIPDKIDQIIGIYLFIPVVGIIMFKVSGFQRLTEQNIKTRNENIALNNKNKEQIIKLNNKIDCLHEKIDYLQEKILVLEISLNENFVKQKEMLTNIYNLPLLNIGREDKEISRTSSVSSLSVESSSKILEIKTQQYNETCINTETQIEEQSVMENKGIVKDIDDDELFDDCYDSLPLNNAKKITGIRTLLGF